jgi:hypothetical protein
VPSRRRLRPAPSAACASAGRRRRHRVGAAERRRRHAGSCTEAALRAAIASRDVVTFNCGADPVTIAVSSPIAVPTDRNTVIDGGGKVTLDGGGVTRILSLMRPTTGPTRTA